LNRFKSKVLKAFLLIFVLLVIGGVAVGAWYVRSLEKIVTAKFEGRKWKLPSKIYADTKLIYPGMTLTPQGIEATLRRLDYRETKNRPRSKGEYRFFKKRDVVEIFLHDFLYPLGLFKGFPVRLSIRSNRIAGIQNMENGKDLSSLEFEPELVTGLYDRIWEARRLVRLNEVPRPMVQAILAIEDERFYHHRGIDPIAVARAFVVNFRRGGVVQGGSTLTQQLMKNFFLGAERTVERKIKEALMALVAEWKYSKEEILQNYLNEIYFGQNGAQGIFGVWEASQFYFSKEPSQLSAGEMALLAGLIKAPNRYSPYRSVDAATRRRNVALAKMFEEGSITRDQYERALLEVIEPRRRAKIANDAPFYTDFLRKELMENYSSSVLTAEGLRIYTSLDLRLQRLAEKALVGGLERLEKSYPYLRKRGQEDNLEGAIVVIKPQTGAIKAMVGGRNYGKSQFNRVAQARRQPGSVFKPFVYLAALIYGSEEEGRRFSPVTLVDDSPFTWEYEKQEWQPANYKDKYFGSVTFRKALEQSLNSVTARIAREVGIKKIRNLAYQLGIDSSLPLLPSLALGAVEVTPLEVARAFSTLANNGVRTHLLAVKQVMDPEGQVLQKKDIRVRKVIPPQAAFMMNHLLRGVVDRGTGRGARRRGFDRPAAGKTGTTNDTRDAWFAGYTPDLLTVVWVGFDKQSEVGLSGGQAALPIWTEFMKAATAGTPTTTFIPPAGIEMVDVDPLSGQRATPECPRVIREAFFEGQGPDGLCPLHAERPAFRPTSRFGIFSLPRSGPER
jgi:penicillin-binding protein 1B